MSRCDAIGTVAHAGVQKRTKLQMLVADNAGVGGGSRLVFFDEIPDHRTAKCLSHVIDLVCDTKGVAHRPRIGHVGIRAAGKHPRISGGLVYECSVLVNAHAVAIEAHGRTAHAVSCALQKDGDRRTVHATAHSGENMSVVHYICPSPHTQVVNSPSNCRPSKSFCRNTS